MVVQHLQHAHPGLHLVLRGRGQQEHSLGRMYRKHVRVQCPGREGGREVGGGGGGGMSKQYNNTLQSFFFGGGGGRETKGRFTIRCWTLRHERIHFSMQHQRCWNRTQVYLSVVLCSVRDAGIDSSSIPASFALCRTRNAFNVGSSIVQRCIVNQP